MSRLDVVNYLPMIAQMARRTWCKLPAREKVWVDVDDMIHDGVVFAKFHLVPRFRPARAQFSTYLYHSMQNFYRDMLAAVFKEKRNACVVPIVDVEHGLVSANTSEHELVAIEALTKLIVHASPMLRSHLTHWLFLHGHVCNRSHKFSIARDELLALSAKCGFGRSEFEYLLMNDGWQRRMQKISQRFLPDKIVK